MATSSSTTNPTSNPHPSTNSTSPFSSVLTASYHSPTNAPFTQTHFLLPTLPEFPSVEEKTAYLRALRAATTELQAAINKELTARMEEDNRAREVSTADGKARGKEGDEKAEEDYGEEVVGVDD